MIRPYAGPNTNTPLQRITPAGEAGAWLEEAHVHPCINANVDDIRLLSEDRIKLIDATEKDLGFTRKGKPRVMFRTAKRKGAVGIHAVVQMDKDAQAARSNPDVSSAVRIGLLRRVSAAAGTIKATQFLDNHQTTQSQR